MAGEELKYLDEILAAHPDNTQGLINPVDNRDGWIGATPALGVINDPVGGVIAAGIDVSVNLELSPTFLGGQAFTMDGNGALVPGYTTPVPVGYTRLVWCQAQFTFESSSNEFTTFAIADTGVEESHTVIGINWNNNSVATPMIVCGYVAVDVSVVSPLTLIMTKATGTATILNFQMFATSFISGTSASAGANFFNGTDRGL